MVMAQGFTRDQVQEILEDVEGTKLIDDKTRKLLGLARTATENSHRIHAGTIQALRDQGCSDGEIFEAVSVTALFNFMDRMADATGAPVEGMREMVENSMNP